MNMAIPMVYIHMSTLKRLAEQCRREGHAVEFTCSVHSGRVLAYPYGTREVSPGSWFHMCEGLYPLWGDGSFRGMIHAGELKDYSKVFNTENDLGTREKKVLYEVVVVSDDDPEDLSEMRT
jgi:hypothetical protein